MGIRERESREKETGKERKGGETRGKKLPQYTRNVKCWGTQDTPIGSRPTLCDTGEDALEANITFGEFALVIFSDLQ